MTENNVNVNIESIEEIKVADVKDVVVILNPDNATIDYNKTINKPQINEIELSGNKSFKELGIEAITNTELETLFKDL